LVAYITPGCCAVPVSISNYLTSTYPALFRFLNQVFVHSSMQNS
jgi:hypothetical protein